jgi:hypothetical protein
MDSNLEKPEILIKEERIKNIIKLRKIKLNQKIFKARQRKFELEKIKELNEKIAKNMKNCAQIKKKIILKFNEEDYFIDPDDIDINDDLEEMNFVKTEDIINNISILLNTNDLNSIMYGVLMMRKFTAIDSILINKTENFIENKLYIPICNILNNFYSINKKLVFECLWILSSLVYDSGNKDMYYFLLNDKCVDLYKKITFFYNNDFYDTNITKVISIFILNMLIFKQKELENEQNIINCDYDDDFLINYLNEFIDLIISLNITEEIYISLLIEITNCFDLEKLLKNNLLNKIIIFIIEEILKYLESSPSEYYYEEINEYYENINLSSKNKINSIYQIILIQLQYFMTHPLKEMPFFSFLKLSEEIINKTEKIEKDTKHILYFVEYINSYISYIISSNFNLSYKQTKSIFDFLIYFIKNEQKNKLIIIACLEGLNNLSSILQINKLIGILISEIPNILKFIENETRLNSKIINEILELLITLIIKLGIKIHNELENEIFKSMLKCLKIFYDCEINDEIKTLLENIFIIISKILEINEGNNDIINNYIILIETKGIKETIYNLFNTEEKIGIPFYLLNILNINL